jgi:hypothetical protein
VLIWVLIAVGVLIIGGASFFGASKFKSGAAEVDDSELEDYQEQFVAHRDDKK